MTDDDALNGPDGVLVRLAVTQHALIALQTQVGRIEAELVDHRRSSSIAHAEALAAIKAVETGTFRLNMSAARWLGVILATTLSLLAGGGTVVGLNAASSQASMQPQPDGP